jgi:aryl carrier-like protein
MKTHRDICMSQGCASMRLIGEALRTETMRLDASDRRPIEEGFIACGYPSARGMGFTHTSKGGGHRMTLATLLQDRTMAWLAYRALLCLDTDESSDNAGGVLHSILPDIEAAVPEALRLPEDYEEDLDDADVPDVHITSSTGHGKHSCHNVAKRFFDSLGCIVPPHITQP